VKSSQKSSSQLSVRSFQGNLIGPGVWRWIKFNAVGALGVGVQLLALAVFRSWMKLDYLLATGVAVEIAVIHNFLWHERFTWADRPARRRIQSLVRLVKFNAGNGAVSIVGNLVLMRVLVGELRLNYVPSNLIAIILCSLANFLLGDRFVFGGEENRAAISTQHGRASLGWTAEGGCP
jgi:putative flippase GtrA